MMIPKKISGKRVVLREKTNQDLELEKIVTNENNQKKKYNLRKTHKLDSVDENHMLQIKVEIPCMLKSAADLSNFQSKKNDVSKENKVKLRGKRQVIKLDHSSKIKSKVSNCELVNSNVKNQENFKSSVIPRKAGILPIWHKKISKLERINTQKKNFDIYDISQDEDLSHIVRGFSKEVKKISKKNGRSVKRFFKKNASKKSLKSTQEKPNPHSNKLKTTKSDEKNPNPSFDVLIQAKDIKVLKQTNEKFFEKPSFGVKNKQLNPAEPFDISEMNVLEHLNFEYAPPELNYDATTILLNVADDFEKSLLHPRMTSTPDTAAMATAPSNNNNFLNNVSHIVSNNRNIVQVVIDTPDSLPAKKSFNNSIDVTLFKLPEPKFKKPTILKVPENPVPKMTSTPYTEVMAAIPSKNNILNDISHIPSNNRNIVQIRIDSPDPLSPPKLLKRRAKRADVTLFESPEPKKKKTNKLKSPQKPVQINLIENFLLPSPEKSSEEPIKKPIKAYHTPDNYKTHLARTKRISEGMKVKNKKSKEDLLIEQMAKHFEEVSGIELCIE